MLERRGTGAESVYRLDKRLLKPLLLLLAMPTLVVVWSLWRQGATGKNLFALMLMSLTFSLFLPWLTRRVVVDTRGIRSTGLFRRHYIPWEKVRRVSGFTFRERAMIIVQGPEHRLVITDIIGNFKHLAGYIIEHASAAVIEDDVAPILLVEGKSRRDSIILWGAVVLMGALTSLQFFW
jgi:hypothetical protein